jgi:flagellar motor component MotA
MIHETSLGLTLMILVVIGGNEIAHLVNPWAAILVMAAACTSGLVAYERAS